MSHTEGKLKRKDFWLDLDEDRNPPISIGAVCKVEISDREAIANADRIVLCWNTHDKLLDACKIHIDCLRLNAVEQGDNRTVHRILDKYGLMSNTELEKLRDRAIEAAIAEATMPPGEKVDSAG